MNFRKIFTVLLAVIMMCTLLTACEEDDGSGYTFRANLASNPQNLDPQLAEDKESKAVIANMMSGLVKKNADGAIVPDAAESYTISDDGLTYTFELKKNITWESVSGFKANMKSDDFVFAFRRIFDSEALYSPYVDDFSCIKNALAVARGEKDKSQLGVKATSDHTLQIELEYPYFGFLDLLTTTAAMPCNEMFFQSTKGRYGLAAETTASNGAFYMKEWNFDPYWDNNYIIMRRNKSNAANDMVYPYSINYFITGDSSRDAESYNKGDIDCFVLENYDKKLLSSGNYQQYNTKNYGLIFNTSSKYFSSKNLRTALAASFSRDIYSGVLENGLTAAYGIVPDSVTIMGKSYRNLIPDTSMDMYNVNMAKNLWRNEMAAQDMVSIDGIKITVPESFTGTDYLKYITEQWQQNLDFYCGIEVVSQNEYDMKIADGTYEILLVEISPDTCEPSAFFDYFCDESNSITKGALKGTVYGYLYGLGKAESLSKAITLYTSAEKDIVDSAVYIPLFYGSEYFIYDVKAKDLTYHPFSGQVDFRYAKYFD